VIRGFCLRQNRPLTKYTEGFNQQSTDNYLYDAAGNVTYDPNKKVSFQYNHLNLAYQMIGSENDTLTILYGADGRLLRRVYKQNNTELLKRDYLSNKEYKSGIIENINHACGRIIKK
jgi:hypothetical protein